MAQEPSDINTDYLSIININEVKYDIRDGKALHTDSSIPEILTDDEQQFVKDKLGINEYLSNVYVGDTEPIDSHIELWVDTSSSNDIIGDIVEEAGNNINVVNNTTKGVLPPTTSDTFVKINSSGIPTYKTTTEIKTELKSVEHNADLSNEKVVIADGTSGVKTSAYTIEKSVPADAAFTDTTYENVNSEKNGLMPKIPAIGITYPKIQAGTINYVDINTIKDDIKNFVGATTVTGGTNGLVPAPTTAEDIDNRFLCADGTWKLPTIDNIPYYGWQTLKIETGLSLTSSSFTITLPDEAKDYSEIHIKAVITPIQNTLTITPSIKLKVTSNDSNGTACNTKAFTTDAYNNTACNLDIYLTHENTICTIKILIDGEQKVFESIPCINSNITYNSMPSFPGAYWNSITFKSSIAVISQVATNYYTITARGAT